MTNKTTYAMVAVVAIAAMSFGLTPAFATFGSAQVQATSGVATSNTDDVSCGTGTCYSTISLDNPNDEVTYTIGTNSGIQCDVVISVTGFGAVYDRNHGVISGIVPFTIDKTVDTGDTGTINATYTNCT